MSIHAKECRLAYHLGFEDGQAAAREAMLRKLDELEQRYLGNVYALEQSLDHYTAVPEAPEDLG
jgi:hypothetical protein